MTVPTPTFITTHSIYSTRPENNQISGNSIISTSTNWGTANLGVFVPVYIPFPYPVNRVCWGNAGVVSGNVDFGIYGPDGGRIYSTGAIVQSGTNTVQYVSLSSTLLLSPGFYYFALSCSSSTARILVWTDSGESEYAGFLQQASAHPLPSIATFAGPSSALLGLWGVTRTTSGF